MKRERIEKAIEVINYAIKNQISVKEASVKCGYSDTYIKNIKAIVYDDYENGILEDELFTLFNDAYEEYKPTNKEFSETNNEKPIDLPSTLDGEKIKFTASGNEAEAEWLSGSNYPADHVKTLEQLLEICEVDLKLWKVKDFLVNKWDVSMKVMDIPQTIQNFQVKARLEKDIQYSDSKDIQEIFADMARTYQPPVLDWTPIKPSKGKENNLLEISIFDLHIGKLAWGGETGENYDTKIARERFLISIEKLLHRASGF